MAASLRRYTQQEIDDLIACPKVVSEAPKREMKLDRGHLRNDMRLKSTDGKLEFRVFMRRSEDLPENFSIGLVFVAKDGSGEVVLLHVHRASAEMIEAGLRPERAATINRDFASYEEAVQYFLGTTNVTNAREYFADLTQGKLRFAAEEPTQ